MKKLIILSIFACLATICFNSMAQVVPIQTDTALVYSTDVDQPAPVESTATFKYMVLAAFLGFIARIVISTIKGWKFNNQTPDQFSILYWLKDNGLTKISQALMYLLGLSTKFNLPDKAWVVILLCGLSCIIGWAIDWVSEYLARLNPKKI